MNKNKTFLVEDYDTFAEFIKYNKTNIKITNKKTKKRLKENNPDSNIYNNLEKIMQLLS